jgi:hypothetical protein
MGCAPQSYLLQFWPAPPTADTILRQTSQAAARWHELAQRTPPERGPVIPPAMEVDGRRLTAHERQLEAVRAWARENGYQVKPRGASPTT